MRFEETNDALIVSGHDLAGNRQQLQRGRREHEHHQRIRGVAYRLEAAALQVHRPLVAGEPAGLGEDGALLVLQVHPFRFDVVGMVHCGTVWGAAGAGSPPRGD